MLSSSSSWEVRPQKVCTASWRERDTFWFGNDLQNILGVVFDSQLTCTGHRGRIEEKCKKSGKYVEMSDR